MATIVIDVDDSIRQQAEAVLSETGQNLPDFLRAWVVSLAEERHEEPNATTLEAFAQAERGELKSFPDVASFMRSLLEDD